MLKPDWLGLPAPEALPEVHWAMVRLLTSGPHSTVYMDSRRCQVANAGLDYDVVAACPQQKLGIIKVEELRGE